MIGCHVTRQVTSAADRQICVLNTIGQFIDINSIMPWLDVSCDWCISIHAVSVCCSLGGTLSYGSAVVVLLDRGHPCFRNFYSTIPVDVVRVKSYVNRLFDPACVPVRITINIAFTSFQSGWCLVLLACSETSEVCLRAGRMSRSCSLILLCIGLPVSQGIL